MDFSFAALWALTRYTIEDPRAAARMLMAQNLPGRARWLLFGIVATASTLLTHIGYRLLPHDEPALMDKAFETPLETAVLQAGILLLTVAGIHRLGRWRGGTGSFADALLLIGWLQIVLLCIQVIQIAALVILPPVAEIVGIAGLVLSFWLLTQFITELHGFPSPWRVFAGILAAVFGAALVVAIGLSIFVGVGG
jgi:hypothetical protein